MRVILVTYHGSETLVWGGGLRIDSRGQSFSSENWTDVWFEMTQVAYSPALITSWLSAGFRLASGQFTYSLPGESSIWPGYGASDEPYLPGFALPDSDLSSAFANAIDAWDVLIRPDFSEVPDNAFGQGTIRVAITDMDEDLAGYAYFPDYVDEKSGDIWLSSDGRESEWNVGSYGFVTLIHELGHTLGLDHPFALDSAPEWLDSQRYTVMSYKWIEERYVSFSVEGGEFFANFAQPVPITPMVLDIATVQRFYGADLSTNSGATTYKFEPMDPALRTIYDANGIDTFDLSAISTTNVVDLQPGAYSSIGMASVAEQIAYWSGKFPTFAPFIREVFTEYLSDHELTAYTFTDNLGIALTTTIENVIGGSGRDEVHGNSASNELLGNAGDDLLVGLAGRDRLDGGDGNDHLYGNDVFVKPSDLATKVGETILSGPVASATAGVPQAGVVVDSDDVLIGGAGNDVLMGGPGRDSASGGSGSDLFLFADGDFAGNTIALADIITDFSEAEGDRIDLSAIDAIVGPGDEAFRFIGTDTFSAAGGELRIEALDGYLMLFGETTGDVIADFAIRLDGLTNLSAGAIII